MARFNNQNLLIDDDKSALFGDNNEAALSYIDSTDVFSLGVSDTGFEIHDTAYGGGTSSINGIVDNDTVFTLSPTQVYLKGGDHSELTVDDSTGIALNATAGPVMIDATGAISLGAGAASDFTVDADLTLETTGSGDINLVSIRGVDIDASGGDVEVDTVGAISLDATTGANLTVTGTSAVDLNLAATTSSGDSRVLISAGSVVNLSANNIDLNATSDLSFEAYGATISLNTNGDPNLDTTAQDLVGAINEVNAAISSENLWDRSGTVLSPHTSGDTLTIGAGSAATPAYSFEADTNTGAFRSVDDNAADMFGVSTAGASRFEVSASFLKSNVAYRGIDGSASAPAITFYSNPDSGLFTDAGNDKYVAITSNGTQTLAISGTRAWDIDAAAFNVEGTVLSLDATSSSNFTVTGSATVNLTLSATSSGGNANVLVAADNEIDLTANTVDLNASGAMTLNSGSASNVTATGAALSVSTVTSGNLNLVGADAVYLNYDDAANGSAFYIQNDGDTMATFGGGIAFTPKDNQDITLTVVDSLVAGPAIRLNADGAAAEIILDGDFNVTSTYNNVGGAGRYRIYEDTNMILDIDSAGVVAWTPNSGSGYSVTTSGSANIEMTASGNLQSRADGELNWYQDGTAAVNRRMQITSAGAIDMTPFGGQGLTVTATGTGGIVTLDAADTITIDSDKAVALTYNNGGGSDEFNIYEDATKVAAFSSAGKITFYPEDVFEVDSGTNSTTGYSLIDGVYYINGSNSTAFATLMQNLTADAQIILGPGTHDISWTTAQTFSYRLKIVGSGVEKTVIRFTSSDADCCLNFTNNVEIHGITFSRSVAMSNQDYAVQLGADDSVIRDCIFETDTKTNNINITGDNCVVDNVLFQSVFSTAYLIYVTGERCAITKTRSVGATCSSGSVHVTSTAVNMRMSDCHFNCAYGSSNSTTLTCDSNDSRYSNVEVFAGEIDQTGHNPQCLTVTGDNNYFSNCVFHGGWDTSTNTGLRITYISGASNHFSNCYWYQRMMDYTLSGNPTDGMVHVNGAYTSFSGCRIVGNKCKCNLYINSSGDYTRVNGCYVGSAISNNGSYQVSAAIWAVSGAHYGNISGNMLRHSGDTVGRCLAGSASNGCSGWVIVGNVCYMVGGTIGIYVTYFTRSTILGNSSNTATLDGSTSGSNTTNQYGTSNTAESTGANY